MQSWCKYQHLPSSSLPPNSLSSASHFLPLSLRLQPSNKKLGSNDKSLTKTRGCITHVSMSAFGRGTQEHVIEEEAVNTMEKNISLKTLPGQAFPLGVSEIEDAINFAIFSQHATSVTLCLSLPSIYRKKDDAINGDIMEFSLDPKLNRTGNVWHICVEDLPQSGILYGYRIDGPQDWRQGHRFDNSIILMDPYAKLVEGRRLFGDPNNKLSKFWGTYNFDGPSFDWGDVVHPNIPEKDMVIYEMNVRAYTFDESSGLDADIRGSYRGIIEKIPHLLELGVNAVELLPVFEFDEMELQRRPNPRDHMVY